MDTKTKNKIIRLSKQGFAAKGIAMAVDEKIEDIQAVVFGHRRKHAKKPITKAKPPAVEDLQYHANYLIERGADPDVVRANFG